MCQQMWGKYTNDWELVLKATTSPSEPLSDFGQCQHVKGKPQYNTVGHQQLKKEKKKNQTKNKLAPQKNWA